MKRLGERAAMKQIIFPSVMAKNQIELDALLTKLHGMAGTLHLDIVHPSYAPNHSLDFSFKLNKKFCYQAHVMLKSPEKWIARHLQTIDMFIPQWEEVKNPKNYIAWMERRHKPVAFALKPETGIKDLLPYVERIDYLLILTVHPGFYGGRYISAPLRRIAQIKHHNYRIKVIVDGGINPTTIRKARQAGCDYFISGSFVSKSKSPRKSLQLLRQALRRH